LAGARHTLVIYMGIHAAERIAARLIAHGRAADTPVAVIVDGTRPNARVHRGVLRDLPGLAARVPAGAPGLIVVGAVAALGRAAATKIAAAPTAITAGGVTI
ncbi:MAG: SAM-dependent methyltransferase, partial [Alphaproteobacteria bacterium]